MEWLSPERDGGTRTVDIGQAGPTARLPAAARALGWEGGSPPGYRRLQSPGNLLEAPRGKQWQASLEAGGLRAFPTASPQAGCPGPVAVRGACIAAACCCCPPGHPTPLSRARVSTCQEGEPCQEWSGGGRQPAPSPARPGLRAGPCEVNLPKRSFLGHRASLAGRREGLLGVMVLWPAAAPHTPRPGALRPCPRAQALRRAAAWCWATPCPSDSLSASDPRWSVWQPQEPPGPGPVHSWGHRGLEPAADSAGVGPQG